MAASTDDKDNKDHAAAFSLLSRWLQSALSDLEKKKECMLIIMQDDGDSFVERAEMYYKTRPELVDMLEDLHKSYRSLSEYYDTLRSESNRPDSFDQAHDQ